jgi:hypothetical protein
MPAPYFQEDIVTKLITRAAPESSPGTVEEQFRDGIRSFLKKYLRERFLSVPSTGFATDQALRSFLVQLESGTNDATLKNRIAVWRATLTA